MQWEGPFREGNGEEEGWVLPEESSEPVCAGKGCIFEESFWGVGVGGVNGAADGSDGEGVKGAEAVSILGFCGCCGGGGGGRGCCCFALVRMMVLLSATDKEALLGSAL